MNPLHRQLFLDGVDLYKREHEERKPVDKFKRSSESTKMGKLKNKVEDHAKSVQIEREVKTINGGLYNG